MSTIPSSSNSFYLDPNATSTRWYIHYFTRGQFWPSGIVACLVAFLINCDFHLRDRQILFSLLGENTDNFYSLTDIDKFKEILTSQRHDVILALGKFIHDGFK